MNKFLGVASACVFWGFGATAQAITVINEVESNDTFNVAQDVGPHDGSIDIIGFREAKPTNINGEGDWFVFDGTAADQISLQVIDVSGGTNTAFISVLELFDPPGNLIGFDEGDIPLYEAFISQTLSITGQYAALVYGFTDSVEFDYRLEIRGLTPTASPVPVPGAVWLFGSGLLGLVGLAKRKRTAASL